MYVCVHVYVHACYGACVDVRDIHGSQSSLATLLVPYCTYQASRPTGFGGFPYLLPSPCRSAEVTGRHCHVWLCVGSGDPNAGPPYFHSKCFAHWAVSPVLGLVFYHLSPRSQRWELIDLCLAALAFWNLQLSEPIPDDQFPLSVSYINVCHI